MTDDSVVSMATPRSRFGNSPAEAIAAALDAAAQVARGKL